MQMAAGMNTSVTMVAKARPNAMDVAMGMTTCAWRFLLHDQREESGAGAGGGEEYGAEPADARQAEGLVQRHPLGQHGVGAFDEHNGVIDDDAGEREDAEEAEEGNGDAEDAVSGDGPDQPERDEQQNDEGLQVGPERGGHDDEHAEHGDHESAFESAPGFPRCSRRRRGSSMSGRCSAPRCR